MTTATEPIIDTESSDDPDTEWYAGYGLALPCDKRTPPCDQEAEWFASQHGCIKAHLCEDHMLDCYREVTQKLILWGDVRCTVCKRFFGTFESFIKAVRI